MFPREYICTNARLLYPVNISSVTIITPWLNTHNPVITTRRSCQGMLKAALFPSNIKCFLGVSLSSWAAALSSLSLAFQNSGAESNQNPPTTFGQHTYLKLWLNSLWLEQKLSVNISTIVEKKHAPNPEITPLFINFMLKKSRLKFPKPAT